MKIQSKIYISFLIIIFLSMSFLGYSVYLLEKNKLLDLRYEQLASLVHFKKREMISVSNSWKNTLNLLVSRTQFRISLSQHLTKSDDKHLRKIRKIMNDAMASEKNIVQILVCDLSGKQVFAVGKPKVDKICDRYKEVSSKSRISDIWLSPSNRLYVLLRKQIILQGKKIGAMHVVLNAHELLGIARDYTGFGKTGEILIARKADDRAQYLTPLRHHSNNELKLDIPLSQKLTPVAIAFQKKRQFLNGVKYRDYRNIPVLSVTEYIPDLGWALVAKIDRQEALSLTELIRTIIVYTVIVSIGISLISLVLARLLTEPLKQLTNTVEVIKTGNWKERAYIHSNDELGYLAESFNEMLDILDNKANVIGEQNKALTLFTKALAHDLKEPIRTVKTFLELIDKNETIHAQQKSFDIISMATDNMYNLVETVLVYVKLSHASELKRTMCNTSEIIEKVKANLGDKFLHMNVELTSRNMPELKVHKILFTQLLQNLVANSLRYADKPITKIDISCIEKEEYYEFAVADNGPGIEEKFQKEVFEPFKRLSRENKSGAGLGLSISQRIVESHNGKIWYQSKLGEGCTFYFTIKK